MLCFGKLLSWVTIISSVELIWLFRSCDGGDPYVFYDWRVSYITAYPLGTKQQVIAVNGQFPGPNLNVTTNWNVVVNVRNDLDEPLLITWAGVQQRKDSWQDGVTGTNCPIPAGWNWTYDFQVKDQIGSFFYFPSLNFQRAAGGYGGITINNRNIIPIPFGTPDGDITLLISDWYTKSHKELRKDLEEGHDLGAPDGVLFNGLGPYHYDVHNAPGNTNFLTVNVEPGKTYRIRVSNVGISTSLNFRIQNHNLILVETEGSYTVQQKYTDLDIHVGQSYSFLVTMDQDASSDYYIVASPRFVNSTSGGKALGVAVLHYSNSQGPVSGPLPDLLSGSDPAYSMTQAKSIRWNLTASAARPNPQGSFRYGQITVTDVYVLVSKPAELINGNWHATLNGISYFIPSTPLKLAQLYKVPGVYKLDFPHRPMNRPPRLDTSLINGTYKGFVEIILQNTGPTIQTYHLDGFAFFVVGMDYGTWTENSRSMYNKDDAVARCTTQGGGALIPYHVRKSALCSHELRLFGHCVCEECHEVTSRQPNNLAQVYPRAWTAIMVSLDNSGIWNLRAENLNSWYLGQELYLSVLNPEKDSSEVPVPDNAIYCGLLASLQRDQSQRIDFSGMQQLACVSRTTLVALAFTLICLLLR